MPLFFVITAVAAPQVAVDPALPDYKPQVELPLRGNIRLLGSDTMNNWASLVGEGFRKRHPDVQIEVQGNGGMSGAFGLVAERDLIAMMSRDFKPKEVERIEQKWGRKPTQVAVMFDMLAVFVHKDNPLVSITLEQLDAIYSSTRKRGAKDDIVQWGQLGLKGDWAEFAIRPQGRNSASGYFGFFKGAVLNGGEYKDAVKENPGSRSVVESIGKDRSAIGYSGVGYATADVKAIALSRSPDERSVKPDPELVYGGTYPLSRSLHVGLNIDPEKGLDPLRKELFRFVFSKQGQEAVERDGYFPLTAAIAREQLKKLGIEK